MKCQNLTDLKFEFSKFNEFFKIVKHKILLHFVTGGISQAASSCGQKITHL